MNKTNLILSSVLGLCFGLVSGIIVLFIDRTMLYLAVIAGVGFAVLLYTLLSVSVGRVERKYKKLEAQIELPILYSCDCNLLLGKKVRYLRLYFCEDRFTLISIEERPFFNQTMHYCDITSWEILAPDRLAIHTADSAVILQVAAAELLFILEKQVGITI